MANPKLTKNQLDWYSAALSKEGQNASYYVLDMIQKDTTFIKYAQNGDVSLIPKVKERTLEYIRQAVGVYGDNAKVVSNELFDYIMSRGGKGFTQVAEFYEKTLDWDMVENKVGYYVNNLKEKGYTDWKRKFLDDIGVYSDYLVKRSAHQNTWNNCDNYDIRYAIVPSGAKTCPFCWMLASRGFKYTKSALNKGGRERFNYQKGRTQGGIGFNKGKGKEFTGYHIHCDCKMIPEGSSKLDVYGYNPEHMQEILYSDEFDDLKAEIKAERKFEGKSVDSETLYLRTIDKLANEKGWAYMLGK